jgi:hypothetical protein
MKTFSYNRGVQKSKLSKNVDTKSCCPKAKLSKYDIYIIRKIKTIFAMIKWC